MAARRALRERAFRTAGKLWRLGPYHIQTGGARAIASMKHLLGLHQHQPWLERILAQADPHRVWKPSIKPTVVLWSSFEAPSTTCDSSRTLTLTLTLTTLKALKAKS